MLNRLLQNMSPSFITQAAIFIGMQSECNNASASRPGKRFKPDAQIEDGFSRAKEEEIEGLIWKYGGIVLVDIPSPSSRGKRCSRHKFQQLPIILCPKKVGC
ncbi:hypothetical protein GOBAR_AA00655 [Gossypium barbadense]|uniref:Uncharacterized protein n=1 Tax=Gossypium barbadense TaxID=3634 RepID=A0A2P5YWC4_GOSBA|nr:hypothetical protein GOBAR_AA00655 [Gossypium barbadense]